MTEIALCIVTRQRPDGLRKVLDAVDSLDIPDGVRLSVVVVDNDPAGSARVVIDDRASTPEHDLRYFAEPRIGIPIARNRALAESGETEYVAFIDDDEVPDRGWLLAVYETLMRTDADLAVGPSVPSFPEGVPSWIVDGGFFERRRFRTGEVIPPDYARTSGVLIRRAALPPAPVFDSSFKLAGESDTHLFSRMVVSGRTLVWCDEATLVEHVPSSRCTVRWLTLRHYRIGNGRSIRMLRLEQPGWSRRTARIGRGLLETVGGLAALAVAATRGPVDRMRGVQRMACGVGLVSGALGITYQEYRVVHR